MNLLPGSTRLTADGVVGASGKPYRLYSVHLVSGATLSTTVFKNGIDSSGTEYLQVDGVSSSGVTLNIAGGMLFPQGCFMDTDANISYCVIVGNNEEG